MEVHAQLKTKTKLFCGCSTQFGAAPNTNICPVCTGQPGALPVLNQVAVEFAIRMGLALNCTINVQSIFARKNYFYPDLPKGYQISQFDKPLCENGRIDIALASGTKRIGVTRIHLEEDAGKLLHQGAASIKGATHSLVDLNRACTPLIEIVSQPDIRSAEEARLYVEKIRSILVFLGICDGNMEEGSLRCDANISIRPLGSSQFGTRTEVKNMNSFRAVEQAAISEIARQKEVLLSGGAIVLETRNYDDESGQTTSMRSKEEAHDYRYFPEPDLLPLGVDAPWLAQIKSSQPKLPDQIRHELQVAQLPESDIVQLLNDPQRLHYFEAVCAGRTLPVKKVANWVLGDLSALANEGKFSFTQPSVSPAHMADLVALVEAGTFSGKLAKEILPDLLQGKSPHEVIALKGVKQIGNDADLIPFIEQAIQSNPGPLEQYKNGKTSVAGFFVGQVMKATQGQAKPDVVNRLVREVLDRS